MSINYIRKSNMFLVIMLSIILFSLSDRIFAQTTPPPSVVLSSYSISGNSPSNEVIILHLIFTNTSSVLDVYNVLITYTSANDSFLPVYGDSNQFLIPYIPAGSNIKYDLKISINNTIPNAGLYFNFHAAFSDKVNGENSNDFFISDIVKSENALKLLGIETCNINIHEENEMNISFKGTIFNNSNILAQNIFMVVEGKNPDFSKTFPLSDIGPGQYSANKFSLTIPSYNISELSVKFIYKDIRGTSYSTDSQSFTVYLNDPLLESNLQREKDKSIFRIVGLGVSLFLLILWIVIFFVRNDRKKRLYGFTRS